MSFLYKSKGEADFFDVHDSYVVITDTDKTITGTALNVGHKNKITKNLPSCAEYWVSYDFYTYGTQKEGGSWFWHVVSLNENSESRPTTALIGGSDNYYFTFGGSGVNGHPGINHVYIHFNTIDGTAELWLNGVYINKVTYSWLKGLKVTTIAFSCTGGGTNYPQRANALSNFTISDTKIDESDIWYNPVLSSNGNWGVDDFAVKGSNAVTSPYRVFDLSCNSYANYINNGQYLDIFIKDPVSLKTIILLSDDADPPSDGVVQSSSDGVVYTDIATFKCSDKTPTVVSLESGLCSYYRILSKNTTGGANRDFSNINLIGTRKTYIPIFVNLDTSRAVQTITTVNADTSRMVAARLEVFTLSSDVERDVYRTELINTDTGRTVQTTTTVKADAARKTVLPFEIDADTQRRFGMSFSVIADTSLTTERTEKINADFSRKVEKTIAVNVDAMRDVQVPFAISADTARKVIVAVKLDTDTLRTVERTETVNGDALRYLVFDMDTLLIPANQPPAQGEFTPFPANPPKAATKGIISMTLELATGTLSDTLNIETFGTDFTPKRAIRGTFLDFPYEYLVEQATSVGKRQTVTCMNQIDQKKYAKVDTGDLLSSAVDIAKKIADSLGMKLETYHEKYTVTTSYSTTRVTAANMMSGLYSWTQNLPWRKINVFFRDKTMYVVQRGYEPRDPYDITALHYPEPTITQAVYRNQYSGSNKQSTVGKNAKTKGFSGSITYPNGGFTNYEDGKPIDSVKYQNGIETDTLWNYDSWGRMTHQIVDTKPASDFAGNPPNENANYTHSEIRVEYYGEGPNGSYEVSETTTVTEETDRKTGKTTKTTTVNYSESAPGSTSSTTINSDGGVASATGGTLLQTNSDFARNQYNTVSCRGKPEWIVEGGGVFDENTITDFPLNDTDGGLTLGEIAAELNAYDRCIQETLQIELVEPVVDGKPTMTHIVDFLERVKFRGNEYYLERNEIERTMREIKQTITAVRWEGNLSEIEKGGGTP